MKVRMLGMDPGIKNFGIGVTELDKKTGKIKVLASSMLEYPISDFKGDFKSAVHNFRFEIQEWMTQYEPHAFIAERFQSRGLQGTSVELISVMLGILTSRYHRTKHKYITAATWKNDVNRTLAKEGTDLKSLYKIIDKKKIHQFDAILMSIYGLKISTGIEIKYDWNKLISYSSK